MTANLALFARRSSYIFASCMVWGYCLASLRPVGFWCALAPAYKFFRLFCPFFRGKGLEVFIRMFETGLAVDPWFPIEDLAGAGDIGAALFRIVDGQGFIDDLLFGPRKGDDLFGELFEGDLGGVAYVHGQVVIAEEKAVNAFDEIVHIAEGAGLAAVAEDGEVF